MIANKVPDGWVFFTADFSLVSSEEFHNKGRVMFKRDPDGIFWWHSLPDKLKEDVEFYVEGRGWTLEEAFEDAAMNARISDEIAWEVVE